MCNGLISATVGLSVTKMGLSSRMVIGVVTNGVAGAVANGSQRLGLGFGLRPSRMGCRGRREWFATIGFEFGSDRRNWLSATVRLDGDWVWE